MAKYTQDGSLIKIDTPLGKDKLLLRGFQGSEGMSRLFRFELDLLSEDKFIDYTQIIGKNVSISLKQANGADRYLNGVISRFGQSGSEEILTSYHAEMVPWLWFLTRNSDCRIFQNMTIPNIIKQVFSDLGFQDFSDKTQATYQPRDYCVQYRETSFNFVSRLMEEYGIFYFFKHAQGQHTLVFGDDSTGCVACPGQNQFRYHLESEAVLDEDVVDGWQVEQELRTGSYSLNDYNFETPNTSLLTTTATLDHVGGNSNYETYDYPGEYLTQSDGQALSKVRMEEEESVYKIVHGTSIARSMVTGYTFTLKEHYRADMNTSYLLTEIQHSARTTAYGTSNAPLGEHYSNSFRCIPASVRFRPLRVTPTPTVMGPQTAVVVGKSGEEITTDPYGRVKVQFYWDRKGKKDENSSCWVRVSQLFAGKGWGAMFVPRIGQEVIVDFLEGDPDQPLITGRVYNADQVTPGTLPANMNVSGWRTHSTKGGGGHDANVLTFDDTQGSEVFYLRAQKDMAVRVENNDDLHVYNDQTITIHNNRTEVVEQGNEKITIQQGNRDVTISQGNDSLDISMGNQSIKLDMGASTTEAMQSITLKVGESSIKLDPTGVTIQGMTITIEGQTMAQVKGDAMLTLKGGIVMIN